MKPAAGLIAAAISLATAFSVQAAGPVAPKISAIRAQLYYEQTGKFSDDILADKNLSLWNTIIGEGGSGGASNFTLVTVEVRGYDQTAVGGSDMTDCAAAKVDDTSMGGPRILRRSIQSFVDQHTLFLPMPLSYSCFDQDCTTADSSQSCKGSPLITSFWLRR